MGLFGPDAIPMSLPAPSPFFWGWGGYGPAASCNTAETSASICTIGGENMDYQVIKKNKEYIFEIVAPSFDTDAVSVSIDRKNIHVTRDKREKKDDAVYKSYRFDADQDATLDISIDEYDLAWEKAVSKYERGIITITIPRRYPAISLLTK